VPEYRFFTLRFRRELIERIDEIWPHLGFCSRMDFFRKALHEYFRQSGEDEVAGMLEVWLQMYDDTTPTE
jgi:metal-responsive CopG/Arc/MetJ family transcriptional regulator